MQLLGPIRGWLERAIGFQVRLLSPVWCGCGVQCVVCAMCVCSCAVCGVHCVGAMYGWCVVWRAERHSCVDSKRYRVHSKRLRVRRQNVQIISTSRRVDGTHGDVLNAHTESFSTFTAAGVHQRNTKSWHQHHKCTQDNQRPLPI